MSGVAEHPQRKLELLVTPVCIKTSMQNAAVATRAMETYFGLFIDDGNAVCDASLEKLMSDR